LYVPQALKCSLQVLVHPVDPGWERVTQRVLQEVVGLRVLIAKGGFVVVWVCESVRRKRMARKSAK